MPVPSQKQLRPAVLEILQNGVREKSDIIEKLMDKFLSQEKEKNFENKKKLHDNATSTLFTLKNNGLIESPTYGKYQLTSTGASQDAINKVEALAEVKLEDEIEKTSTKLTKNLNEVLLAKISKMNAYKFEFLVGDLFTAMGYEVEITKGSGDGGIDGFIHRDELKPENICFQVKRQKNGITIE